MVSVTEKHKKMIQTIIKQSPQYIQQYPQDDQRLLNEFLNLLTHFDEAEYQRTRLLERFIDYNKKLYGTDLYLKCPFLWFTETYIEKAITALILTDFNASSFFEYLTKHLRKKIEGPGVFDLIRKKHL